MSIEAVAGKVEAISGQIDIKLKEELEVRLENLLEKWRAVLENTKATASRKFPVSSHTLAEKPSAPTAKNTCRASSQHINNSAGTSVNSSISSFVSSEALISDNGSLSLPEESTSEAVKYTPTTLSPKATTNTTSIPFVDSGILISEAQTNDDSEVSLLKDDIILKYSKNLGSLKVSFLRIQ